MRRFLLQSMSCVALAGGALAQVHSDKTGNDTWIEPTSPGGRIILNGNTVINGLATITGGTIAVPSPLPHVSNATALGGVAGSAGLPTLFNDGTTTPGDGGGAFYAYSATPCSIGAGLGDGYAQIAASYGGCWNMSALSFAGMNSPTTGSFFAPSANIFRLNDRVLIGGASAMDALAVPVSNDWASALENTWYFPGDVTAEAGAARFYELSVETMPSSASANGAGGIFAAAQSKYSMAAGTSSIGIFGFAVNNNTTYASSAWGLYSECHQTSVSVLECIGLEAEPRSTVATITPYPYGQGNVDGIQIGCGAGLSATGQFDCSSAIQIVANPMKWKVGINFMNTALTSGVALALAAAQRFQWYDAAGHQTGYFTNTVTDYNNTINLSVTDNGVQFVSPSAGNVMTVSQFGTFVYKPIYSTPVAIASLPACAVSTVGAQAWVNNGVATPTYHQTVGTIGATTYPVYCIYDATYRWVY